MPVIEPQCEAHVVNLPSGQCILTAGHDEPRTRPATASEIFRYGLDLVSNPVVIEQPTSHVAHVEWSGTNV